MLTEVDHMLVGLRGKLRESSRHSLTILEDLIDESIPIIPFSARQDTVDRIDRISRSHLESKCNRRVARARDAACRVAGEPQSPLLQFLESIKAVDPSPRLHAHCDASVRSRRL